MIYKDKVIEFFDKMAPSWDEFSSFRPERIERILDIAGIGKDMRVLDVATGTGVMIPFYLARGCTDITGIDISPAMLKEARKKYPQESIVFLEGDAATIPLEPGFDAIMLYNAYPHFPDPELLLAHLASLLKPGGSLTVAHGAGKAEIDGHHRQNAHAISNPLPEAEELGQLLGKYVALETILSEKDLYIVSGRAKK